MVIELKKLVILVWVVIAAFMLIVTGSALFEYEGESWIYLLFSFISGAVLFFGFGKGAIFFDAFLGVFLWLGFWVKFSIRVAFLDGDFLVPVGGFDGSGDSFDRSLLVVSIALFAILLVRVLREKFSFKYAAVLTDDKLGATYRFYVRYRWSCLVSFIVFVLVVALSNYFFGFYQRGVIARTVLPFGLNGVYAWLLTFGLAIFSAQLLYFEALKGRGNSLAVVIFGFLEAFLSNVSMLSRGMILNSGSLVYGMGAVFSRIDGVVRVRFWGVLLVVFFVLFCGSVVIVNSLRFHQYGYSESHSYSENVVNSTSILFLERWVGIEGVMSVVGKEGLGRGLLVEAAGEKFDPSVTGFYDKNFVGSYHSNSVSSDTHFVSLPGYIAFFYYSGSYVLVFFAVFCFSVIGAMLEYAAYRLGRGNLVVCAVVAQVVAFRYTSFGYVPMQSYKLVGGILLSLFVLYTCEKICALFFRIRH